MAGFIAIPVSYDSPTEEQTLHPSGAINLINRYPERGPNDEGFPGNTEPVVEVECSGGMFLTAREAERLGVRLIRHAAMLMLSQQQE